MSYIRLNGIQKIFWILIVLFILKQLNRELLIYQIIPKNWSFLAFLEYSLLSIITTIKKVLSVLFKLDQTSLEREIFSTSFSQFANGFKTEKVFFDQLISLFDFFINSLKFCLQLVTRQLLLVRNYFSQVFKQQLVGVNSSLVEGMVLGENLDRHHFLKEAFKTTGLLHVLSVSGYNISLVALLISTGVKRLFSRKLAVLVSLVTIWLYGGLVSLSPPVTRALVMATLALIASGWLGRQYRASYGLGLSAGFLLLLVPSWISNIGFQLSFSATLGLTTLWSSSASSNSQWVESLRGNFSHLNQGRSSSVYHQPVTQLIHWCKNSLTESFKVTLTAQALTAPLLLFYFKELSLISLGANTFLLWLVPLITYSGISLMLLALIQRLFVWLNLVVASGVLSLTSNLVSGWLYLISQLFLLGVDWFSHLPGSVIKVDQFPAWAVVLWWLIVTWLFRNRQSRYV